jgi:hypothetical protein
MAHQGVHEFLTQHVFPSHFAAPIDGAPGAAQPPEAAAAAAPHLPPAGAPPSPHRRPPSGAVSEANLQAIARGLNVMNDLRAYLAWKRNLPKARKPLDKEGYVKRIVAKFTQWNWVIIEVEAPVLVREWDLQTRLDVVVWDKTIRKFMQVEIKVGYRDFEKARGTFYPPFEHVPNSGVNQARAQAVVATLMTERDDRFPRDTPIEGIYVVWVRERGITLFRPEAWCVDFLDHVRNLLDAAGPGRRAKAGGGAPVRKRKEPPSIVHVSAAAMEAARAALGMRRPPAGAAPPVLRLQRPPKQARHGE